MPVPKIFKSSSSKSNPSETSPTPDVPADGPKKDAPQTVAVTTDGPIPEYSDNLKEAWTATHRELPRAQGVEKFLNKIGGVQNSLTLSPGQQTVVDTLAVPVKALMDTTRITETIQRGVDTFMEAAPVLMKTLDEVAKIHPFISVAVLAFKAVYTLETKRRGNDKRVLTLYVEMKDMMAVLVQLEGVSGPKHVAPDGQTIEGRMKKLCEDVAEDIKKCANACDAYLKKKILVKIFAGPVWDERLLEFTKVFMNRRKEFEFRLTIHTATAVGVIDQQTVEISQKMDIMLQLFQEFVTPEQKKLTAMVEERGGDAVLKNEQVMKELVDAEPALTAPPGLDGRRDGDHSFDIVELQSEIDSDPDEAIEKNAESFSRKFDIQTRQIKEDITRVVKHEGDRIISAVTAGPHDRIVDPDIYNIWKDMGWRGNIEGRHFVMSLKDYCIEKAATESSSLKDLDDWAIKYINIGRARSVLEAFDDDASGFVTVNEVNNLTRSRPRNWSLPHWIAYWAIGWQMTCTTYCEKIEEIFDAMIRLAYEVLPKNRKEVNAYIDMVWQDVTIFVQSIKREDGTEELRSKFESHVTAEEVRLKRNFEDIKYNIDSYDTVQVIAGGGRAEMTLFPMLYLALKRDLEKISLARKYDLSVDELDDASETIHHITEAAKYRIENLRSIFEQQNLDAKGQFKVFANGLYNISCVEGAVFRGDKLRELPDPTPCRDEIIPDSDSIPLSILNYPLGKKQEPDFAAYDPPELALSPTDGADPVLGTYYGFIYEGEMSWDTMIKLTFTKGEDENTFVAAGKHYRSTITDDYEITGKWSPSSEDGGIVVEFKIAYIVDRWANIDLTGVFDPEENSLRGTTLTPAYGVAGEFVFKRDPDFVRFYPAPSVMDARKRWEFATTSVLDRIRRKAWSPARILKRIKDGKRYRDLVFEKKYGRYLSVDEIAGFRALLPALYEADVRFYASLIDIDLDRTPIFRIFCDNCGVIVRESRIICMDCHSESATVDLCSEPKCVNSTITFKAANRKTHTPNHSMFKVRRAIFDRDTGRIERTAKDALDFARETLSELEEENEPMPACVHCMTTISLPFWCCVDCPVEKKFICDNCENKGCAFNKTHTKMHTLARVSEEVEEKELSVEERLRLVEDKLSKMQLFVEEKLAKMQCFVGGELMGIRQLLANPVEKDEDASPGDPLTKGDLQAAVIEVKSTQPEEVGRAAEDA